MSWLIWRQHRGELVGAMVALAVLGLVLITHGIPMHEAYNRDDVAACNAQMFEPDDDPDCVDTLVAITAQYSDLPNQFGNWLPFLPMLAGMLIGAPLLARELEQGTWQLAWTQGVTRTRWLVTKFAAVLGGVVAASVLFAAGMSWWIAPQEPDRFTTDKFNHSVLVFPAYVLLAVAIGVLAGVVVKRTIAAAAIVVGGYLMIRLPVEFGLRPRFREPLTTDEPRSISGWFVDGFSPGPDGPPQPVRYHPDSRFWEFQLIEVTILAGITAVLLFITWRLVVGRRPKASLGRARDGDVTVG